MDVSVFERLSPMLVTADMQKTLDFYCKTLGFSCVAINDEGTWCALQRDRVEIMFSAPNPHMAFEKAQCTGYFYITVLNVDAQWERVRDQAEVVYPIENFSYRMREFAIRDNNGYILQFGSPLS